MLGFIFHFLIHLHREFGLNTSEFAHATKEWTHTKSRPGHRLPNRRSGGCTSISAMISGMSEGIIDGSLFSTHINTPTDYPTRSPERMASLNLSLYFLTAFLASSETTTSMSLRPGECITGKLPK